MTIETARLVVENVLEQLSERKGFDDWWRSIDEDVRIEMGCEIALELALNPRIP